MGVPVLEAPGEAEAQCAQLSKEGAVYGVSTEDMDALTFGTARLVRNLMAPASQVRERGWGGCERVGVLRSVRWLFRWS
jgi:5'-3' exonuclease